MMSGGTIGLDFSNHEADVSEIPEAVIRNLNSSAPLLPSCRSQKATDSHFKRWR
jgi:hypothetical protein